MADSQEKLLAELPPDTLPLWKQMTRLNPPLPAPTCVPHIWHMRKLLPLLQRAGHLVSEAEAERRVLMLINPGRNDAPYTTDTLYAGLQLVMPHETAPAHRHVAFAMRFVISGTGGFTAVDGQRVRMARGDVILTPQWAWHDHGNEGPDPVIWLDALNLPLFQALPVHFVEHYKEPRYPAKDVDKGESPIVFPWAEVQAVLDAKAQAGDTKAEHRYRLADGAELSTTIGAGAVRVAPGQWIQGSGSTASGVYHVVSGSGRLELRERVKLEFAEGDTFCVPAWQDFILGAGEEPVYLYYFDDIPLLRVLGFYRERTDEDG
ncbi:RmlC-like cupin [Trichodelitschia bisporula]|uniref:RmlC-like cupin n=1 Tax=Trichodelitschia bisporula TaxID=703511 RepID=A0A6G1HVH0_9PEZI|nr:RmlC-like cupin [Trichodelitschia bisporula]